jgi:ribulose-bisphosphate carboxylase large chain
VEYHLHGSEPEVRAIAEALCFDQTVELPDALVEPGPIRDHVIGRVEHIQRLTEYLFTASVSFSCDLVGKDFAQLLGVVFGIASLRPGIRVARLDLPESFVRQWPGPRFGRYGLRHLLGILQRPLVCGVLKPVGLSPSILAERAYRMALGGLDFIKDDQGLVDQAFCPFDDRVLRCAKAVAQANRETGRTCLYIPHVTGSAKGMYTRCLFAKQAGAGGVLICPGLAGFEAVNIVAEDETLGMPIMTHPTFLGSLYMHPDHGMAPAVVFGQLPRLAGADVSIYPSSDGHYSLSRENCRHIASETALPWGHVRPIFPTAAGRISGDRIKEVVELYGKDLVIIVGGGLLQGGPDITSSCQALMKQVEHLH